MASLVPATIYGDIAADFAEERLANLCDPNGGVQTGPFGSQLHQRDYVAVGTPIITVEHLGENRVIHQDVPCVSDKDRDRLSKYTLRRGDIVFSRVGSVDRRALVREAEDGWLFSGRCLRVRPNRDKIDPGYLSYFFGLPSFKEHIRAMAVGATMPSLNTDILSNVVIRYPRDVNEQRAIAHILSTLDDKIDLNRRLNETLEAMARAIFQAWFVDFEPVRAKMEGRWRRGEFLPGLPAHLYDLFPERLIESELGPIPVGWEVKPLPSVIDVNPPRVLRKGQAAPYLDMGSIPVESARALAATDREFGSGARFMNGDTLVARITPCLENGKTCFVDFLAPGQVGWGSTEYIVLRPKSPLPPEFGYFLARTQTFRTFAISNMTGTSGRQRVPAASLGQFYLAVPGESVAREFGRIVHDIMKQMRTHDDESYVLGMMRDTLLPKLIGGDVRVTEIA